MNWAKGVRCDYCNRRLFMVDFERGLAEYRGRPESPWLDIPRHTYDCEKQTRRWTTLTHPPAPAQAD